MEQYKAGQSVTDALTPRQAKEILKSPERLGRLLRRQEENAVPEAQGQVERPDIVGQLLNAIKDDRAALKEVVLAHLSGPAAKTSGGTDGSVSERGLRLIIPDDAFLSQIISKSNNYYIRHAAISGLQNESAKSALIVAGLQEYQAGTPQFYAARDSIDSLSTIKALNHVRHGAEHLEGHHRTDVLETIERKRDRLLASLQLPARPK